MVFSRSESSQGRLGVLRARYGWTGAGLHFILATANGGTSECAVDFRELRNHGKYEVYTPKCALWFFKAMPLPGGTLTLVLAQPGLAFCCAPALRAPTTMHFLMYPGSWDMCILFRGVIGNK